MAAPKGSHNRKKAAHWTDALKLELANYDGGSVKQGEALREIALNVVKDALDRTSPHYWNAVQEIGNRLDGKPAQAVTVGGEGDDGSILIQQVKRLIVHADSGNTDSGSI
jgi:hypothetical protein